MFCSNCGKEISDNAKFCKYCGKNVLDSNTFQKINETAITNIDRTEQINTVFNRDVLNNYLYNIRALEFSKNNLQTKLNNMNYQYGILGFDKEILKPYGYLEELLITFLVSGGLAIAFKVAGKILGSTIGKITSEEFFYNSGTVLCVLSIIIGIIVFIGYIIASIREKSDYETKILEEKERIEKELVEKSEIEKDYKLVYDEYEKISNILGDAYSLNIIPSKFRNIYASYFLYDFISTSTASLNEALLHCDLDTIQRQLENVIQQQAEMIMELARSNALNEQIIAQNNQMLNYAIQTENNTALAAQYAKAAETNTSVTACIAMSEYLKS